MKARPIGGILLILGTSIGAGMLALPIAAAYQNNLVSTLMLLLSWAAMTLGAFMLLEVNVSFPDGSNIISMARTTLGKPGLLLAWFSYLLLLYALLCAYISGGSDVVQALFSDMHLSTPHWLNAVIVVLILGGIVYRGLASVDIVNRGLMGIKIAIYILIVSLIMPHVKLSLLTEAHNEFKMSTLMVMMTSFGYAIIIPSLRTYYQGNIATLKKVVFIGSLLPLVIYLIWILVVQGVVPRLGHDGLLEIAATGHATSGLMMVIDRTLQSGWLSAIANIFISICVITSFLGVSYSLTDFIADGLGISKSKQLQAWAVYAITFIPPLIIVIFAPGIFISALSYAGIFCVLLLILLPIMMAWSLRYWLKQESAYRAPINRGVLILGAIFSLAILGYLIWEKF